MAQNRVSQRKTEKKYNQSVKGKATRDTYRQSEKGKAVERKADKKYVRTEKGRINAAKKQAKRKRNLGFIPLMSNPFPKEILVDYHHINDIFVVPVPRIIHKGVLDKNHRIKVNDWIEEIIGDVGVY